MGPDKARASVAVVGGAWAAAWGWWVGSGLRHFPGEQELAEASAVSVH